MNYLVASPPFIKGVLGVRTNLIRVIPDAENT